MRVGEDDRMKHGSIRIGVCVAKCPAPIQPSMLVIGHTDDELSAAL